jgi:hypothetical protein
MRKGDILEWRAVNGICRGIVTESENGELICRVDDKTAFPLKDLLDSFSLKVVSARNL